MSKSLVDLTKDLQRELGVKVDGVAGRVTLTNALAAIQNARMDFQAEKEHPARVAEATEFDARTEGVLATLDPKAVPMFRQFLALAQATAASMGCDYILISGNRTWAEQDALYAQGRTKPGAKVTNAKGGSSNHNFGIAVDAGVFAGKLYLDNSDPAKAAKVHKACSEHAAACGLEWGGSWTSIKDMPHYEVRTGLSLAEKRSRYQQKGSVL
jgi:peptidoglycan L-alanyl-D-glutamate endopeptidase CwlK